MGIGSMRHLMRDQALPFCSVWAPPQPSSCLKLWRQRSQASRSDERGREGGGPAAAPVCDAANTAAGRAVHSVCADAADPPHLAGHVTGAQLEVTYLE